MTDIGSIIPDTAKSPVAPDLVHPQQAQHGSVSGHLPTDSHADQKVDAQFGNGQAQEPAKAKSGVVSTILTAPIKGPRNGIHWGAGVQLNLLLHCMHCPTLHEGTCACGGLLQAPHVFILLLCLQC